jgi:hypothetical protein
LSNPVTPAGRPDYLGWAQLVAVVVLGGGVCCLCCRPPQPPPAQPPMFVTVPQSPAEPTAVEGRFRPGQALFAKVVRKRLRAALTADGFNLIGGNPTPLTAAEADELVSNLDDDYIIAAAKAKGAVGDGRFLDRLDRVLDWLLDHRDEIAALVKWLLLLLSLL